MSPRVRAAAPWVVVAAVLAAIVCAVGWPVLTGWAVGCAVGAWALVHGVRQLLEEQRPRSSTGANSSTRPQCAGCVGCGGPDCVQHPAGYFDNCPAPGTHNWGCGCPTDQINDPELTADEARALADELGLQLYRAEDALAFVAECCDIADRNGRQPTTADVRTWLKGAQCARQTGLILPAGWIRNRADQMGQQ